MQPLLQPNSSRARYALAILICVMAYQALYDVLQIFFINSGQIYGTSLLTESLIWNLANVFNIGFMVYLIFLSVVELVFLILAAAFFIRWFRRAYTNYFHAINGKTETSPSWASGSWFVPGLNFFMPFRMMAELETNMPLAVSPMPPRPAYFSPIVIGWWMATAASMLTMLISILNGFFFFAESEGPRLIIAIAAAVAFQASAVLSILLIRKLAPAEQFLMFRWQQSLYGNYQQPVTRGWNMHP